MARLAPHEIRKFKAAFEQWQSPIVMGQAADTLMDRIGSADLFNQAGLTFILEANVAAAFAIQRGASEVHLTAGEWPDFEIRVGQKTEQF